MPITLAEHRSRLIEALNDHRIGVARMIGLPDEPQGLVDDLTIIMEAQIAIIEALEGRLPAERTDA